MKFYFCDKCGKRVTEQDLAAGQARDKQLAGIFCAGCAAGVATNPHEPVQEATLPRVGVRPPTGSMRRSGAHAAPPRRRTTGQAAQLAPPRDAGPREERKPRLPAPGAHAEEPRPRGRQSAALAFWGAVAVVVLGLVAGGMWVVLNKPQDRGLPKATLPKEGPRLAAPKVSPPATAKSPESTVEAPKSVAPAAMEVAKTDAELRKAAAQREYETLIRFEGIAPEDRTLRLARVEDYLTRHGEAAAEPARALRLELQVALKAAKPPDHPAPIAAQRTPPVEVPPQPANLLPEPPFDRAMVDELSGLLRVLRDGDLEKTMAAAKVLRADERFAKHDQALAEVEAALGLLRECAEARRAAFVALKGQDVSLETLSGLKKGRAVEAKDDLLLLQPEYRVNGELRKGEIFKVKAAELTEAAWERLAPTPDAKTEAEHLAKVLSYAGRDRIEEAEAALATLKGKASEELLRHGLDFLRQESGQAGVGKAAEAGKIPRAAAGDTELDKLSPFAFKAELHPEADAQVYAARKAANLGALPSAQVQDGGTGESRVLIRFRLDGFHSSTRMTKAGLRLGEIRGNGQDFVIHEVASGEGTWTELGVTADSLPPAGALVARAKMTGEPPRMEADLTALLAKAVGEGRPVLDLWLNGTRNNTISSFCTREGATPPRLELEGEGRVPLLLLDTPPHVYIQNPAHLGAQVLGAQGEAMTVRWEKIEGPGQVAFKRSNEPKTEAYFTAPGEYVLSLQASQGARKFSARARIQVSALKLPLEPQADTFVSKGSAENFGKKHELQAIFMHGGNNEKNAYLRFDLRSVPQGFVLQKAVLRLDQARGANSQIKLVSIEDDAGAKWMEEQLNWDNQPKDDGRMRRYPEGREAGWVKLDVTDWVADRLAGGKAQISFGIQGHTNNVGLTFCSREGRNPPELVLFGYRK